MSQTFWNNLFSSRYADDVSIYDEVLVHDNDRVMPAKVINISNAEMQGNCQSQRAAIISVSIFL